MVTSLALLLTGYIYITVLPLQTVEPVKNYGLIEDLGGAYAGYCS